MFLRPSMGYCKHKNYKGVYWEASTLNKNLSRVPFLRYFGHILAEYRVLISSILTFNVYLVVCDVLKSNCDVLQS